MLLLRLQLNGQPIGIATARDMSDGEYRINATSYGSSLTGTVDQHHAFKVKSHDSRQGAWALVAKIAAELAECEGSKGGEGQRSRGR